MNYKELVISKTPSVYVTYDNGTPIQTIGSNFFNSTAGSNPTYPYTAKKQGARSRLATGSANQDYRTYSAAGTNATIGVKSYYWHGEFFIYLTGTGLSNATLILMLYSNGSGSGTYTSVSAINLVNPNKINFTTNNNTNTQPNTIQSNASIPNNQWVHIALQYDYGVKRIYIDGILDIEVSTGLLDGIPPIWSEAMTRSRVSTFTDEFACWNGFTTTRPANFPTAADILQRATFPITKTKWWDPATSQFLQSADELYWTGTAWESMQDQTYRYWNGTSFVTL